MLEVQTHIVELISRKELQSLRECLGLSDRTPYAVVTREFARSYWWDHDNSIKNGNEPSMPTSEKFICIARLYEREFRDLATRKS